MIIIAKIYVDFYDDFNPIPYVSIDILLSSSILIKNTSDSQWNMPLFDKIKKKNE